MKEKINKEIYCQDKKILFWGTVSITIIMFFFTNMHSMIFAEQYGSDPQEAIKQYFSLAPFKNWILYFIYGILACFLLRNLDVLISDIEKETYSFKEVFLTKISELSLISALSSLNIIILKVIVFLARRGEFKELGIGATNLLMFFLLSLAAALLTGSGVMAGIFTVKNKLLAIMIIPCAEYCLYLFFGLFNMLLSGYLWPLKWLIDQVGRVLVDYFVMVSASDLRIELKPLSYQVITLIIFVLSAALIYWIDYMIFSRLNSERVKNAFYFSSIKKVIFVMVAFIAAFTLIAAVDLVVLVFIPRHFDIINLLINIAAIILAAVFYRFQTKNDMSCDK